LASLALLLGALGFELGAALRAPFAALLHDILTSGLDSVPVSFMAQRISAKQAMNPHMNPLAKAMTKAVMGVLPFRFTGPVTQER
jgi:hypothetical protein